MPTSVVRQAAAFVASEVRLINVDLHVLEVLRLAVEHELMQVAAVVHAYHPGGLAPTRVEHIKNCPVECNDAELLLAGPDECLMPTS